MSGRGAESGAGGGEEGPPSAAAEELARLLRQREEIGGRELFLEGLTRDEVIRLVEAVRVSSSGAADPAPPAAPGARRSRPDSAPAESARPRPARPSDAAAPGTETPDAADEEGLGAELAALDYEAVRETALGCTRCALAGTRTQVVFSDGSPEARLVVVGEAPGANEDREGLPFVGPAGKMLDLLLASIGLSRGEDVYICNVIKCRPPGNRNPTPVEIEACSPYLRRQISLVAPAAVLAVGSFAAKLLTGTTSALGRLRGEVYSYEGVPLVVTYHPAALLRNPGWTRPTWDDLQLLRRILDG